MKTLAILLSLTAVAGAVELIPQAFPKERYVETKAKSPFVLETKVAEAPVVAKNPFENLYVRIIGKADGKDYVLIQRIGEERAMKPFIGNEPGTENLTVKEVRSGGSFRETKVVLQQGDLTGEVGFKQDSINLPPAAPQGRAQMPGGPKPGQNTMPPGMQQAVRPSPGGTVQAVPRPGGAVPLPTAPQNVNIPKTPGAPQRPIRVINN